MNKHLTIIGAGPKAVAIAAKAAVLKKLGFRVPGIKIIEKTSVGAHWQASTGFTSGRLKLGTSPEKDIGFPYASSCWGDDFNRDVNKMMLEFSWQSFLIEGHSYSAWIDRGRPSPNHNQWTAYLRWVFERFDRDDVELIEASFEELAPTKNGIWKVSIKKNDGACISFETDGLVLTGPGEVKIPDGIPDDPRIMDVHSVWWRLDELAKATKVTSVAIVGNGETAASAAVALGRIEAPLKIEIIAPVAMNYSRGESFSENHMYTDPFQGNWHEFTIEDRKNFIERTDRGVFSLAAKKELDHMENVTVIPGWFRKVGVNTANQLVVEMDYAETSEFRAYDYVVLSIGFDPLKFLTLRTSEATRGEIMKKANLRSWAMEDFERKITEDLSISGIGIHLPMLAALEQGPGFPNLSALGRLSDHILLRYVSLDRP